MARSRIVKPDFFLDDELAQLSITARLAFVGLWGQCDRDGRCEDRPSRLKTQILPYDAVDMDAILDELARPGFVIRYAIGGRRYLQVRTFLKHQNPHPKEGSSGLPPPPATAEPERAAASRGFTRQAAEINVESCGSGSGSGFREDFREDFSRADSDQRARACDPSATAVVPQEPTAMQSVALAVLDLPAPVIPELVSGRRDVPQTPHDLKWLFGRARMEALNMPLNPPSGSANDRKADRFVTEYTRDGAAMADIAATMRLFFAEARGDPKEAEMCDPNHGFGFWIQRFPGLRERLITGPIVKAHPKDVQLARFLSGEG